MKNLKLQRQLLEQVSSVLDAKMHSRQDPLLCLLEILAEVGPYSSVSLYLRAHGEFIRHAHVGAESPIAVGAASQLAAAVESGQVASNRGESEVPATAAGMKSQAVVPIRRGAVTVGALALTSRKSYAFGTAELAMLKAVARRLAVFLATTGKRYLRNIAGLPQSNQTGAVTAAVA